MKLWLNNIGQNFRNNSFQRQEERLVVNNLILGNDTTDDVPVLTVIDIGVIVCNCISEIPDLSEPNQTINNTKFTSG